MTFNKIQAFLTDDGKIFQKEIEAKIHLVEVKLKIHEKNLIEIMQENQYTDHTMDYSKLLEDYNGKISDIFNLWSSTRKELNILISENNKK